jgi:TonB family protein
MTHLSHTRTGARRVAGLVFSLAAAAIAASPARAQTAAPATATPVWDAKDVTVQPALINERTVSRMVSHSYPGHLLDAGITGNAMLELTVDSRGQVEQAAVVGATHQAFGLVAKDFARAMRFSPAKVDGRAVRCRVTVPVQFALADG